MFLVLCRWQGHSSEFTLWSLKLIHTGKDRRKHTEKQITKRKKVGSSTSGQENSRKRHHIVQRYEVVESMAQSETKSPLVMWQHRSQGREMAEAAGTSCGQRAEGCPASQDSFPSQKPSQRIEIGWVFGHRMGMGRKGLGPREMDPRSKTSYCKDEMSPCSEKYIIDNLGLFLSNLMTWNKRNSSLRKE